MGREILRNEQNQIIFVHYEESLSSEDVRQTHDLSLKPSHPLNSGSRRPPSECFLCVAIKNAARIRQSLAPLGSPHTTPLSVLVETNVLGLLAEALTAQVEVVLADQTGSVLADAALARALAVVSRARVPDAFVGHDCGCGVARW